MVKSNLIKIKYKYNYVFFLSLFVYKKMSEEEFFDESIDIITNISEDKEMDNNNQFYHNIENNETTILENSTESSIWKYFDKNPSYALGYNVCKDCSNKYKLITSVSSLRKHLRKYHYNAPSIKQKTLLFKRIDLFNKQEQNKHNKYLV